MSASGIQREVAVRLPARQRAPDRLPWTAAFVLSVLLIVPVLSVALAAYTAIRINDPSDEELITTFLSHEVDFQELARMVDADRRRLSLAGDAIELTGLAAAGASAARIGDYENRLKKMGVKNFRYFPRSGNIILPVSERSDSRPGCSRSYRYLPQAEPQHLVYHQGYEWRGPGIDVMTGNRRIKGQWFIHHETTVWIGFSPY